MFLADNSTGPVNVVVSTLDGVTTVLTAFIFVCLVMPAIVKHRPQFYAALACVAGIIVLHTLTLMFNAASFGGIAIGVLQLVALLLLVLCVGGLTVGELAGELKRSYEVIRRGETEKEVIIPLGDQAPVKRARGEEAPRKVYKITPPSAPVIDPDDETEDHGIPFQK
jgi:hypothetical protein